jgi:hypothetical protein
MESQEMIANVEMGFVDIKADDTVQSPTHQEWQEGHRFRAKRRLSQFRRRERRSPPRWFWYANRILLNDSNL